uniref:protein lin-12-like n=1 Tax=Erigeron canadensis TaxID=72917 RepID=UPI001CB8EDBB|nr:protein lin-12-like [Erigeron canadensis]
MAVSVCLVFSLFLLSQPWTAVSTSAGDILAPILSPIFEDVCQEAKCGQGICKPSDNSTIPFECECSPGWKQVLTSDDDNYLKFLPCVIPNCTLNHSCLEAPPPMPENDDRRNGSIFDVCRWADCGAGKCEATSLFTHKCECTEGYHNLLNLTFSPCFKECSLGMDCKDIGFGIMNRTSPPSSFSADNSNQANFRFEGSYHWVIFAFALLDV